MGPQIQAMGNARRLGVVWVLVLCCLALPEAECSEVQALEAAGAPGRRNDIALDALSRKEAKHAIETAERKEALKSPIRSYEVVFGKRKERDRMAESKKGKVARDLASMVKKYEFATGRAAKVGKAGDKAPVGGKGTRIVRQMKKLQIKMMGGRKKYNKFDSKNEDKAVTSTGPLTSAQYMKEVAQAEKDYNFGIKGIPPVKKTAGTATIKRGATPGKELRKMKLQEHTKQLKQRKTRQLNRRLKNKPNVFALLETEATKHEPTTAALKPRKKSYGTKATVSAGKASIAKTHSLFAQAEKANAAAKAAGVKPPNSLSQIKELDSLPKPPAVKTVAKKVVTPAPKKTKTVVKKVVTKPPVKKKKVVKKPKTLAGSHQAWHTMMHQRADAIERGIKAMKERKAKARQRPKAPPKAPRVKQTKTPKAPKKLSKVDHLKQQAKELQMKATKSRHLAYKLQRKAAVSVGAPQKKADWAAEQEKTVAGFMQNQADEARDALVRYLSKNKRKLERKKTSIMMKKKAKRKAIKAQKKVLKQKAKKEKKKLVKKAVKAAKKKV